MTSALITTALLCLIITLGLKHVQNVVWGCVDHICRESLNCGPQFLASVRSWLSQSNRLIAASTIRAAHGHIRFARISNLVFFSGIPILSIGGAHIFLGLGISLLGVAITTILLLGLAIMSQENVLQDNADERLEEQLSSEDESTEAEREVLEVSKRVGQEKPLVSFVRAVAGGRRIASRFFRASMRRLRRDLIRANKTRVIHKTFIEYIYCRTHLEDQKLQEQQSLANHHRRRSIRTPLEAWAGAQREDSSNVVPNNLTDRQVLVMATTGQMSFGQEQPHLRRVAQFDELLEEILDFPRVGESGDRRKAGRTADDLPAPPAERIFRLPGKTCGFSSKGHPLVASFKCRVIETYDSEQIMILHVEQSELDQTLGFLQQNEQPARTSEIPHRPPRKPGTSSKKRKGRGKHRARNKNQRLPANSVASSEYFALPHDRVLEEEATPGTIRYDFIRYEQIKPAGGYRVVITRVQSKIAEPNLQESNRMPSA